MNSKFDYYKTFYYIAKYENITKAAGELKTSQPAVTRSLHNLEEDLGCRLFERSKKGVKLTPEGKVFYKYIEAGCSQFFKGENDLRRMSSMENGTIYISATETALHCYLFQAIGDFNEKYPNVRFAILNNSTSEALNAVKEGRVDLAFLSSEVQTAKPVKAKVLRTYKDILIGGSKYQYLADKKRSLQELASCAWVSLTSETITRRFMDAYFERSGLKFQPDVELETTDMILPAVCHNLGLGFIPSEFAENELKNGQVHEIRIKEDFPERTIVMVYDTEYPQSIASREFRKFLKVRVE